jgi:hypothetical protein
VRVGAILAAVTFWARICPDHPKHCSTHYLEISGRLYEPMSLIFDGSMWSIQVDAKFRLNHRLLVQELPRYVNLEIPSAQCRKRRLFYMYYIIVLGYVGSACTAPCRLELEPEPEPEPVPVPMPRVPNTPTRDYNDST